MTASRVLAAQLGVSEETCKLIDALHIEINEYVTRAIVENFDESKVKQLLTKYESQLQVLWGFPVDERFHVYFLKYQFKKEWYNRKFKCNTTGEVFTVPIDVEECTFYQFGESYLDVGRLGMYSRFSNCTEIVSDNTKGDNI